MPHQIDRELDLQGSYCMGACRMAGMYGGDDIEIPVTVLQVRSSYASVPE